MELIFCNFSKRKRRSKNTEDTDGCRKEESRKGKKKKKKKEHGVSRSFSGRYPLQHSSPSICSQRLAGTSTWPPEEKDGKEKEGKVNTKKKRVEGDGG